jgi:hypothetical protein
MVSLFTHALFEGSNANAEEVAAFNKFIAKGFKSFAEPAGSAVAFPDFGLSIEIDGKRVDLHIEYKMNRSAQMGSMRDWIFDGSKFTSPAENSNEKQELLALMNESEVCINNGKRLLVDLKKYVGPEVDKISSGSLNFIKDNAERKIKLREFAAGTDNFQLANIESSTLGDQILTHYKHKFKPRAGADYSILVMMMGSEMWVIQSDKKVPSALQRLISESLGVDDVPVLKDISAKLEVRIQPRGLNSDGRGSIDVMASLRLQGKSAGAGAKIH